MIFVLERNAQLSWASAATERITGWPANELCGQGLTQVRECLSWNLDSTSVAAALTGLRQVEDTRLRTREGELRRLSVEVDPLRDEAGQVVGALLVARDETELQRLRSVAEAVNLATNIGQMFAGIRHELGNPINSIKTALTVLRTSWQQFDSAHVDHYFERMLVEVGRVEYLLRSLRSFSAFENLRLCEVSLNSALAEIARLAGRTASARAIDIMFEIEDDLRVEADERALYQVLLNLVTNAMDAVSESRGTINLSAARASGGRVVLEVVDDGPGIPADLVDAVRRPFFTTKGHGTGLGLTIVDRLVAEMNAEFAIESRPGRTVMRVVLAEAETHG